MTPGFYRGEWFEEGTFREYPTGADAAYWDGQRWWFCPPEAALTSGDVLDELRDICLYLISQGIMATDTAVEREERHRRASNSYE